MKKLLLSSILLANIGLSYAGTNNGSPLELKFPRMIILEKHTPYNPNYDFNNFITTQCKQFGIESSQISFNRNFIDGTVVSIKGLNKKQSANVEKYYSQLTKTMDTIDKNNYFTDIYIENEKENNSFHTALTANNFYLSSGFAMNKNSVVMMLTMTESNTVQQNISIMHESNVVNLNIPFSYESAPRKYKLNDKYSITITNINQ